jgi:tRNA modification GTPase
MASLVVDTIVAQATPAGFGGIAIIRASGPKVCELATSLLGCVPAPRQATYLVFRDTSGEIIDEGIAVYFPNPHSFTGEDVLELHGHGGPVVVDLLLQETLKLGARLARPGEFSERAFLNGKMDLAQAEAVADLIDATSQQAARLAVRTLQGDFSKAINALNENIIQLRIFIEAAIDFVDEEIDFLNEGKIAEQIKAISAELNTILSNARQGSFLREGITAVIAGEPNVGKSSLLNRLSGKDVAIVTNVPGTTRDVLRDYILIDDMPMHVVDTAGLRETDDVVEQEGIRRARNEIANADLVLLVVDDPAVIARSPQGFAAIQNKPSIIIRNKIDLNDTQASLSNTNGQTIVSLSAKTGAGIDLLKNAIKQKVGYKNETEGVYLARRRHLDALNRAKKYIDNAYHQLKMATASELAAEDLRLAQLAVCEITGEFTPDDLLGRIFSSFCIGK